MSLDKAIRKGRERRRPYTGAKAVDCTCRNHGSCYWCRQNRLHRFRDRNPVMAEDMEPETPQYAEGRTGQACPTGRGVEEEE